MYVCRSFLVFFMDFLFLRHVAMHEKRSEIYFTYASLGF